MMKWKINSIKKLEKPLKLKEKNITGFLNGYGAKLLTDK